MIPVPLVLDFCVPENGYEYPDDTVTSPLIATIDGILVLTMPFTSIGADIVESSVCTTDVPAFTVASVPLP